MPESLMPILRHSTEFLLLAVWIIYIFYQKTCWTKTLPHELMKYSSSNFMFSMLICLKNWNFTLALNIEKWKIPSEIINTTLFGDKFNLSYLTISFSFFPLIHFISKYNINIGYQILNCLQILDWINIQILRVQLKTELYIYLMYGTIFLHIQAFKETFHKIQNIIY